MKLSRYEQETVITYNNEEKTANIWTCDKALINKLNKLIEKDTAITEIKRNEYSRTYKLPKRYINIKIHRQLSEEQRQKLAERAKRNFGGKNGSYTHTGNA